MPVGVCVRACVRACVRVCVLNVHRNRKAYKGRGYGGEGGGGLYTYRYTVTTRLTSALRWAAMRAILMFHNCEEQSHKTVSTDHNL